MTKSEFVRARCLARDMSRALRGVRLTTSLWVDDFECPTYEMWELLTHVKRSGSLSVLSGLARICREAESVRVSVTLQHQGDTVTHELMSPDMSEAVYYLRAKRTFQRKSAERSAATTMERERSHDAHRRFMTPLGSHRTRPGDMSEDLPFNSTTARMSAGASHRRSVATPHTPQHPSVQKGVMCDSARNCGQMSSRSVSRVRRGGRKYQTDKRVRSLHVASQATSAALSHLRRQLGI